MAVTNSTIERQNQRGKEILFLCKEIMTNPNMSGIQEVTLISEQMNKMMMNTHDDEQTLEQIKGGITKQMERFYICSPWKESKVNLSNN
ncbi:hypothetical protein LOAG_16996 [Loa loa]|uniref:Uncharacterized protein n=1 Tax=Loa loa TaxID=7209 RepID=A0A1S0UMD1_LOALO|nr:hypothetical protein LOAG_16996 [Loa loa]EJD75964.1 hypothetical protein LOAG_16996 [Loa loa]